MRPHCWYGFVNIGLICAAAGLCVGPRAGGDASCGSLLSPEPLTTPALCWYQDGETEIVGSASLHAKLMRKGTCFASTVQYIHLNRMVPLKI